MKIKGLKISGEFNEAELNVIYDFCQTACSGEQLTFKQKQYTFTEDDDYFYISDSVTEAKEVPLLSFYNYDTSKTDVRDSSDNDLAIYDLKSIYNEEQPSMSIKDFNQLYNNCILIFCLNNELEYKQYISNEKPRSAFVENIRNYLKQTQPGLNPSDAELLVNKIERACFGMDILEPLISNPDTTDIKICGYDDIRIRIKGKAYSTNLTFLSEKDYKKFIISLRTRHAISADEPLVTFTDNTNDEYKLRFCISNSNISCNSVNSVHIRKVRKSKMYMKELVEADVLPERVRQFLIDKGKTHTGIVFAGPPGSGKTTLLNAFIEYIPKTRETLVIQENDELFTDQKGFIFQQPSVVRLKSGEKKEITLEELSKMALVEGCNEFIIGEVKGGEMRNAMTLLNSGGHIALTCHAESARKVLDKLADLVKYGSDYSFQDARMQLSIIDTIVYAEGFKIREIIECIGYDTKSDKFMYKTIYKRGLGE